jgi:hypothetical protein
MPQGIYLDPDSYNLLDPLTNTSGMRRALEIFQQLMRFNSPASSNMCTGVAYEFLQGRYGCLGTEGTDVI